MEASRDELSYVATAFSVPTLSRGDEKSGLEKTAGRLTASLFLFFAPSIAFSEIAINDNNRE
jgi:hypothetical protein